MPIPQNNCATPQTIQIATRFNLARDSLTAPTPSSNTNLSLKHNVVCSLRIRRDRHPLSNINSSQHSCPDRHPLSHTSSQHSRPDRHPLSHTSSSQHSRPDLHPLSHTSSSQHSRPDRPRSHRNLPVSHCPRIL